tara:strand:- start:978 stop:1271 length:294 start_codon:yes stop_codon:yes gene_type:complete
MTEDGGVKTSVMSEDWPSSSLYSSALPREPLWQLHNLGHLAVGACKMTIQETICCFYPCPSSFQSYEALVQLSLNCGIPAIASESRRDRPVTLKTRF